MEVMKMANCETCKSKNVPENVPYLVHERAMARTERHTKRIWIALLVAIAMLFASNAAWLYAWCQYDYVSEEQVIEATQDGEGINIVGGGNIAYGANGEDYNTQENP